MKDNFSKAEIRKDALQDGVEAVTHAVGQGTQIVIGAVSGIAKTVGGLATDLFEIAEQSRKASADVTAVDAPAPATPIDGAAPVAPEDLEA